jgi:hypothetical protein
MKPLYGVDMVQVGRAGTTVLQVSYDEWSELFLIRDLPDQGS